MEDGSIVELLWSRDQRGLSAAEEKYGGLLRRVSSNILGSPEDAEECVNDTLMRLWERIPPARPARLGAYAVKILRETAFNRFKRDRAEKRGGGETALVLEELSELVSGGVEPGDELDAEELAAEIDAFLSVLPAEKRKMFVRRYFYAESVGELANYFGISENRVSVTLSRLRDRLRRYLRERGYNL